ncbi:transposase [Actinoplanes siamensis]|uniref:Uncharacterized protein n=1 Tax=Actinoplanes siamensis TaxID=1223317 RepID=A0A919N9K1_9ACTN|nr:transposase [Actinoplanes siamensis]GIF06971.1 hypothetical protein Asi03nite_45090 [Actinoplanes siamensis]
MTPSERVNSRNGHRRRELDTRGTIDVAIPNCGPAATPPSGCSNAANEAAAALVSVVATCYLLGISTRRMDKLVQSFGITNRYTTSRDLTEPGERNRGGTARRVGRVRIFTCVGADRDDLGLRGQV